MLIVQEQRLQNHAARDRPLLVDALAELPPLAELDLEVVDGHGARDGGRRDVREFRARRRALVSCGLVVGRA